jgi:transcriptional regulator with XRE-family HTH domain
MDDALASRIKTLRVRRHLTQAQLADRIGVSTVFIRKLEAGDRLPSLDTLQRLAEALDAIVRVHLIPRKRGRHGR